MGKQIRVAVLGDYINYYSYFVYGVMEGAIRCGTWFRPIPIFHIPYEHIWQQIDFFKPNILFCHCIFNRSPWNREKFLSDLAEWRKKLNIFVCYHAGDARLTPRYEKPINDYVDLVLCNNTNLGFLENIWKVPCINWPYMALYQDQISDVDKNFETELTFTGSLSTKDCESVHHTPRTEFIERIQDKIKIKVYPDIKIGNSRFFTDVVASSSKGVLGFQMGLDVPGYLDVRPFQYIGAGALYFQDKHPHIDTIFSDKIHYVGFDRDNVEDFMDKYNHFVNKRPSEGDFIRRNGFNFCQKFHSTKNRVQKVIDIYKGK